MLLKAIQMKLSSTNEDRIPMIVSAATAMILLISVLLVPAVGYSPTTQGDHTDWSTVADRLIEAEDWQGLLDLSVRWTQHEPENATAWFDAGMAYGNLERYREAAEAYRKGVELSPDSSSGWYDLGNSYGLTDRYDDAIAAYVEAIRLDPDNLDALINLGHAYIQVDRYDKAIQIFHRARSIDPASARVWNNLAIAYFLAGNKAEALHAVLELKRLDPTQAEKVQRVINAH